MSEIENSLDNGGLSYQRYAFKAMALIIGAYFVMSLGFGLIESSVPAYWKKAYNISIQAFLELFCILLPAVFFALKSPMPIRETFRVAIPNSAQTVFGILGILAFQAFASSYTALQEALIPSSLMPYYREIEIALEKSYSLILSGDGAIGYLRAMAIGALIPAFAEESLFRGFFQRSLEEEMSPLFAIAITSVIFSILHFNPIGFIPLIVIGLYLGAAAYFSRSIALPILLHFINNAVAVSAMFNPQINELDEGASGLPLGTTAIIFILSSLAVAACAYQMYQIGKRERKTII